jgi:hypothetical protein
MGSPKDKERPSRRMGKLLHNVMSCIWGEGSVGVDLRGSCMDRGVFGAQKTMDSCGRLRGSLGYSALIY